MYVWDTTSPPCCFSQNPHHTPHYKSLRSRKIKTLLNSFIHSYSSLSSRRSNHNQSPKPINLESIISMGKPQKWLANVRRKIQSTPAPSNIILLHTNPSSSNLSQHILLETTAPPAPFSSLFPTCPFSSPEEIAAAIKIQALFSSHLRHD